MNISSINPYPIWFLEDPQVYDYIYTTHDLGDSQCSYGRRSFTASPVVDGTFRSHWAEGNLNYLLERKP